MIMTRTQINLAGFVCMVGVILLVRPLLQKMIAKAVPIRYVQVEGAFQYLDKEDIQNNISPLLQSGYFSVDLQSIQYSVMSLPWVEKVQVQRIWPDRLKLRIYEQQPIVRWLSDSLLNIKGDVFTPINIEKFQTLPVLYAPVDQRYQLLRVMDGIQLSLMDLGLYLAEFRVSDRQAWLLALENGLIIQLGRFQPLQKFTLLMRTLMITGGDLVEKMAYIDMRYPNGYAVRWRGNEQLIWKK